MRFTPTRVGNSIPIPKWAKQYTVHPHTRGEFLQITIEVIRHVGSPPHAWGILPSSSKNVKSERFTPTRVGNSYYLTGSDSLFAVHPHTRGEFCAVAIGISNGHGSPPHAWGIHLKSTYQDFKPRFTPTRVGNSNTSPVIFTDVTVHPHTRGEFYERFKKIVIV